MLQEVVIRHRRLVAGADEPFSAASRLSTPILAVLAGKDEVTPPAITKTILARVRGKVETWAIPDATHAGAEKTAGYFDRVAQWFKRWAALPPGAGS